MSRPIVPAKSRARIRWMIRSDMPAVEAIENECFEFPWPEDEFFSCLRRRNCIGMVAEEDDKAVGFMIYELHKYRLHILNFAVGKNHQRTGVGSTMLEKLCGKLSFDRRDRILLEVRETNLAALLFFKASGFRAISILRNFYDPEYGEEEDAYLMQYRYQSGNKAANDRCSTIIV